MNKLLITVVVPTYNNEVDIRNCLASIRKQNFPQKSIEILICDGGSKDNTLKIAKDFNCRIVYNKKKLAEYGVALGFSLAKGEFITVLAADNEFLEKSYFKKIIETFYDDKNIILAYPKQVSSVKDTWISKYINTFTDPVNHFIYGSASNTRTFSKIFPLKRKSKNYLIYNFSPIDYPMIALAQGTTVRKKLFVRNEAVLGDDIFPIVNILNKGYDLAYVPEALLVHHTIKSISIFIKKQRWSINNYLLKKGYGLNIRTGYFSKLRIFKIYFWPFYAASFFLPIINSIKGLIIDRNIYWIYHPFLTFITFLCLIFEVIRVKILKKTEGIVRGNEKI
ncbi:glycosyltransferase [Candidatus Microgenomates bacterium]|nr:MAG: glycosyltransferase [Candidatus Microgenomates bacterium]